MRLVLQVLREEMSDHCESRLEEHVQVMRLGMQKDLMEMKALFKDMKAVLGVGKNTTYCANIKSHNPEAETGCSKGTRQFGQTSEQTIMIGQLKTEVENLKSENKHLVTSIEEQKENMAYTLSLLELNISDFTLLMQTYMAGSTSGTFIWTIPDIRKRRKAATDKSIISLLSVPFFSKQWGYKLCMRMYPCGDGVGADTHVSLFVSIMKGEHDSLLEWPFSLVVEISVLHQLGGNPKTQTFKPDPLSKSFVLPEREMNTASGFPKFMTLSELYRKPYVVNDTLYIKCVIFP